MARENSLDFDPKSVEEDEDEYDEDEDEDEAPKKLKISTFAGILCASLPTIQKEVLSK